MVNVQKGVLIKCEASMKQFLVHLDEQLALGERFIIQDLDDNHLFVMSSIVPKLQARVDEMMEKYSFSVYTNE